MQDPRPDTAADRIGLHPAVGRPPDPATLAAGLAILDAWAAMGDFAGAIQPALEQVTELRLGQLRVLRALGEPMRIDELATELGEHPDAVTATVTTLRRLGLVAPLPAPPARADVVDTSAAGRAALARASGLLVELLRSSSPATRARMLAATQAVVVPLRRLEDWLESLDPVEPHDDRWDH